MKEVKPKCAKGAKWWLRKGQRVCAFWSGKLAALYPGTVMADVTSTKGERLLLSMYSYDVYNLFVIFGSVIFIKCNLELREFVIISVANSAQS